MTKEENMKLLINIEKSVVLFHLLISSIVLGGSVTIILLNKLDVYVNIIISLIIFFILVKKIKLYESYEPSSIAKGLIYIVVASVVASIINWDKAFNCAGDLGWHVFFTFYIRGDYNLTKIQGILLPYQFSPFNYPGVYFITNFIYPLDFEIDNIEFIVTIFNIMIITFYTLIGITISLFVWRITNNWKLANISLIIYMLMELPSDYMLRGNLPDLMGWFYTYSSIYILLLNHSFPAKKDITVYIPITIYTSIFLHPYALLYLLYVYRLYLFYIKLKKPKMIVNFFQKNVFIISLILLYMIFKIHPITNVAGPILQLNDWRGYVIHLVPFPYQLHYLINTKLRLVVDIVLASLIIAYLIMLIFIERSLRKTLIKYLVIFYLSFYIFYNLPLIGIQVEPQRFMWRSFDYLPLFNTITLYHFFRILRWKYLISAVLILVFIYDLFLIMINNTIEINYLTLNHCKSMPTIYNDIIVAIKLLTNITNYTIITFGDINYVPFGTYFTLAMLNNPSIRVYPVSYFATYVMRGDLRDTLLSLHQNYTNCILGSHYIYIYPYDYKCHLLDRYLTVIELRHVRIIIAKTYKE